MSITRESTKEKNPNIGGELLLLLWMIMAGVTLLLIMAAHANNLYNIFQTETVNVKHVTCVEHLHIWT